MDKLLLTPEEAAEALSVGRSKLYELLSDGLLDSVRVGACRRIPVTSLIDFVGRLQRPGRAERGPGLPGDDGLDARGREPGLAEHRAGRSRPAVGRP